jgi:hypothetical protein
MPGNRNKISDAVKAFTLNNSIFYGPNVKLDLRPSRLAGQRKWRPPAWFPGELKLTLGQLERFASWEERM